MADKRELRRQAKQQITPKGVFAVRCTPSGEVWVSSSGDLNAARTGLWFMLRNGMHRNQKLQAAWDLHGQDAFVFEVMENLDDDVPALVVKDTLRDRQKHWQKELGAAAL